MAKYVAVKGPSKQMPVRRFLIITADDFGLDVAVNEAVEQASRAGVLTAASLMVAGPAAGDAIRRARSLPNLNVGLHLVLADGCATLPPHLIPSIAGPSGRIDAHMFLNACRFFALPSVRRQMELEVRAQFAAFARSGLRLDHVNAHKHFHLHPTILQTMLRVGREYGIAAVRVPEEPLWFAGGGGSRLSGVGAAMLKPWARAMRARLRREGIFCNDALFGIGSSGAMNEEKMLEVVARLPDGVSEIYLHPAAVSGRALTPAMKDYAHAAEFAALMSARLRAALDAADIGRGGYGDARR